MNDFWTSDRVEQLTALHSEGHAYSYIGQIMGISREAVSGKVFRLELGARPIRTFTPRPNRPRTPPKPLVAAPPPEAPPSYNLDLMAVTDRTCRFPYGDGPFAFCGHTPQTGSVYCGFHTSRARQAKHPVTQKLEASI